jgi:prephenate dehydrogenase
MPRSADAVAVIGTGLMGTSIAMAARRAGHRVAAYDADPGVLESAAAIATFELADSLENAVAGASIAFVCTPIPTFASVVSEVLSRSDAVVSDVGSVKSHVVEEVERASPEHAERFLGGHPMGGSERSGPDGASASVLDGIAWVLTPTASTDPTAVDSVGRFVSEVSHLPQVASTALMGLAAEQEAGEPEILQLAAAGFRDLTRLAASNPDLWAGILRANADAFSGALDLYVERLNRLRELVSDRNGGLERAFADAKRARLGLAAKPQVRAGVAVLQVPVPDRPGVLADLTAALGAAEVNIEDLQIVHSPEGGRGTVHLTLARDDLDRALACLGGGGFEALRLA